MAHIQSIGAGMFSDLAVTLTSYDSTVKETINTVKADPSVAETELRSLFSNTSNFTRIQNIREFPAMGVAPNVVNVPVFGQKVSRQTQGQADAPSMELQINYVAEDWDQDKPLAKMIGDGKQHVFRFTILNSKPKGYDNDLIKILRNAQPEQRTGDSEPVYHADTDSCENTEYYFWGKMEAMQVTPQLTDATTATLTISIQSDFYGAYTLDI